MGPTFSRSRRAAQGKTPALLARRVRRVLSPSDPTSEGRDPRSPFYVLPRMVGGVRAAYNRALVVRSVHRARALAIVMRRLGTLAVLVASTGCGHGTLARTPELRHNGKCRSGRSNQSPLVVEWSSSDRARFEGLARSGVIVARYTGCELEVLTQCRAPGDYRYDALTPKQEVETIQTADELYTKIPIGAASLAGELTASGSISVDMTVVGRFSARQLEIREDQLVGRCLGATHIVSGLTVGAFSLASGSTTSGSIAVDTVRFGGGGAGTREARRLLQRDGDASACLPAPAPKESAVTRTEPIEPIEPPSVDADGASTVEAVPSPPAPIERPPSPPDGCSALIRLDLAPLPRAEADYLEAERVREAEERREDESRASRRALGWGAIASGAALGAGAGVFALLGDRQNAAIRDGGYTTSADIEGAESTGRTFNVLGYALAIGGGVLLSAGMPLVLFNPKRAPESPNDGR